MTLEQSRKIHHVAVADMYGMLLRFDPEVFIRLGIYVEIYQDKDRHAIYGVTKEARHEDNIRRLRARRQRILASHAISNYARRLFNRHRWFGNPHHHPAAIDVGGAHIEIRERKDQP